MFGVDFAHFGADQNFSKKSVFKSSIQLWVVLFRRISEKSDERADELTTINL